MSEEKSLLARSGRAVALGIATVALMAPAPAAHGATSRADYGANVNAICASANSQAQQLEGAYTRTKKRLLKRARRVSDKKFLRIHRRIGRLDIREREQLSALFRSELEQRKQVAPAPGDEALVAEWLSNREVLTGLYDQRTELDRQIQRVTYDRRSGRRALARLLNQVSQIGSQAFPLSFRDFELAAQLGAGSCVRHTLLV